MSLSIYFWGEFPSPNLGCKPEKADNLTLFEKKMAGKKELKSKVEELPKSRQLLFVKTLFVKKRTWRFKHGAEQSSFPWRSFRKEARKSARRLCRPETKTLKVSFADFPPNVNLSLGITKSVKSAQSCLLCSPRLWGTAQPRC